MRTSFERTIIALAAVLPPSVIVTHAFGEWLHHVFAPDASQPVYLAALAVILAVGLGVWVWWRTDRILPALAVASVLAVIGVVGHHVYQPGSFISGLAVLMVVPVGTLIGILIADRLPLSLDGACRRMPIRSYLWGLLALLALVQTVRLSSHMADPEAEWWITTKSPFFAEHMCVNAYLHAADLNRQGVENVYDKKYYPGINPNAEPQATVKGLTPDDPYQYPPQFLLLPRLALAFTNDFQIIKVGWFAIQTLFFLVVAWWLAVAVGGNRGLVAALLIPAIWVSFPVLSNFQYGQFHLVSVALALLGMLFFRANRFVLGGAALAAAIFSKIAPGILLIYLLTQRRWKAASWTLGFGVIYTLLAVWVIGVDQFIYFFTYHLPRLQDGTAFSFAEAWPDYIDLIIAGNQSPYGFILKLDWLGLPGMSVGVARLFHLAYTLGVIALGIYAARRFTNKATQPLVWLALLNLAALVSKGAWGDYISLGTVWLLTFLSSQVNGDLRLKVFLMVSWAFMALSLGIMPSPLEISATGMIVMSTIGIVLMIGLNAWYVFRSETVPVSAIRTDAK